MNGDGQLVDSAHDHKVSGTGFSRHLQGLGQVLYGHDGSPTDRNDEVAPAYAGPVSRPVLFDCVHEQPLAFRQAYRVAQATSHPGRGERNAQPYPAG